MHRSCSSRTVSVAWWLNRRRSSLPLEDRRGHLDARRWASSSTVLDAAGGVALPSPLAFDTKSAILPASHSDALKSQTVQRRTLQHRTAPSANKETEIPSLTSSSTPAPSHRFGCDAAVTIIGIVDNVQHGKLVGGTEVVQCRITSRGHRTRQLGDLKLFQNEFIVRLRGEEWVNFTIPNGTRAVVRGSFAMHSTYDMVSKSTYENSVIDVGPGGYVGILELPKPKP